MQGLTWRHARALACQSVTVEFASGEPLAWTCPSIRTAAAPDRQTPSALKIHQTAEIEKWWPIVRAANIKAE